MDLNLHGKRVAIAGASRGTGLAIAKAFRAEGADIWLTGRNESTLSQAAKSLSARFTVCDLEKEEGREAFFHDVEKNWGSLDVLVLNIGSGRSSQQGLKASAEEWTRVWNLNFLTHADLTAKFTSLLAGSKGAIVSVSSIAGQARLAAPSAYTSAKAALDNFCLYASAQLAAEGIRYNIVAPGNIFTPGGSWDDRIKADKAKVDKYIQESVPMKRFATPTEVAASVVFLASSAASFCTGSVLRMDGGQSTSI